MCLLLEMFGSGPHNFSYLAHTRVNLLLAFHFEASYLQMKQFVNLFITISYKHITYIQEIRQEKIHVKFAAYKMIVIEVVLF